MSTASALHSIRRLLAFACILLSLAVAGIGEVARAVDYGSDGGLFLAVGLLAALASALWFLFVLVSTPPTDDGDDADDDAGDADGSTTESDEDNDTDDGSDADVSMTAPYGPF